MRVRLHYAPFDFSELAFECSEIFVLIKKERKKAISYGQFACTEIKRRRLLVLTLELLLVYIETSKAFATPMISSPCVLGDKCFSTLLLFFKKKKKKNSLKFNIN